ncbi:hypothetical protein EJD97_022869 [Solanum chilense]|uniref:Uncharacterized protein n=1 Tax=Solanum chilense TaxID=4083 RepID=A0A6N2C8V2_SOLCI|nr:hypothetical protein EJD97_022869 [Solanum chilense]
MAPAKRKIDTTDTIKIQKKARTKVPRKNNENTTLFEELSCEAVSSSQVEAKFSQKEYEEKEKEKMKLLMMEKEQKKLRKIKEKIEKRRKKREVVVHEEEKERNDVEDDDEIKIINVDTFSVHLQPNANGDSIIRPVMGKPFNNFRVILKRNNLEDFF